MKKSMLLVAFLLVTIGANAQFEKGKWIINPSITGLELTHSKADDTCFGITAKGGAFLADNWALLLNLGAKIKDGDNRFAVGVSGRHYIQDVGVYVGAGFDINHTSIAKHNETSFSVIPEVGYAFFITKTVTIEPALYYNWNTKNSNWSEFGLKIGFGIYF